jgi:hypothetical protein
MFDCPRHKKTNSFGLTPGVVELVEVHEVAPMAKNANVSNRASVNDFIILIIAQSM